MPKAILDTAAFVDLQRASKFRNQSWAANTMKHAASFLATNGKPGLSPLGVMEISGGFKGELRQQQLKEFQAHILPMFETRYRD